jgi:hypothetical protein
MDSHSCYQVNSSLVSSEIFENELVVIHFVSGDYFSLDLLGAEIWDMIKLGFNLKEIVENLILNYAGEKLKIQDLVLGFLQNLCSEDLIFPFKRPKSHNKENKLKHKKNPQKIPFPENPIPIQKHSDMQELIKFEPIKNKN